MEVDNTENYIVFDIETTGLEPWRASKVTCICAKDSDGNVFSEVGASETRIIDRFIKWLDDYEANEWLLVTKGGDHFDIPFICARQIRISHDDKRPPFPLLSFRHFDLSKKLKNKYISLQDMATILGIPGKLGTGLGAISLFNEGKYDELKKYCLQDVELTEYIFNHWRGKDVAIPGQTGFSATPI